MESRSHVKFVLIKCPFETLLKLAEKLQYKMPIEENTMRYEQNGDLIKYENSDQATNLVDEEDNLNLIPPKLKKKFIRRFEPKEIKNYYDNAYHLSRRSNCNFNKKSKIMMQKQEDEDTNLAPTTTTTMCKCSSGCGTKRYFTAPFTNSMREK